MDAITNMKRPRKELPNPNKHFLFKSQTLISSLFRLVKPHISKLVLLPTALYLIFKQAEAM